MEERSRLAAEVLSLVREREGLASQLARIDAELDTIRRALAGGPSSTYLEQRTCRLCRNPFQPKRKDQHVCSTCRQSSPTRSNTQLEDKQALAQIIEARCKGYAGHGCHKMVKRRANRRGPLRCPDCHLANKRAQVRSSLEKQRKNQQGPSRIVRGEKGQEFNVVFDGTRGS